MASRSRQAQSVTEKNAAILKVWSTFQGMFLIGLGTDEKAGEQGLC